jgi:hypothetical protein
MAQKNFELLVTLVKDCQEAGLLAEGPADIVAVSLWSLVHGFILLLLEGQISHTLLERMSVRTMLISLLNGITKKEIEVPELPLPTSLT